MKKIRFIIAFTIVVSVLSSCADRRQIRTDTLTSGIAEIAVDECLAPIMEEEITVFEALNKDATIIPTYTNNHAVYDLLMNDSVRLIVGTRDLTMNERAIIKEKKQRARVLKIAIDGIALIVNKSNTDSLISVNTLKQIMTGKVRTWKEINPQSKLGNISVVFDSPNSSTVKYINDSICAGEPMGDNIKAISPNSETIDIRDNTPNRQVIEYVSSTPNAIGIIGVNWISNPSDSTNLSFISKITVMGLSQNEEVTPENSSWPFPFQLAMEQAWREDSELNPGRGYPLTRDIYMIITDASGGLTSGFVNFVGGDRGQRIILKAGLVPANRPWRLVNVSDK